MSAATAEFPAVCWRVRSSAAVRDGGDEAGRDEEGPAPRRAVREGRPCPARRRAIGLSELLLELLVVPHGSGEPLGEAVRDLSGLTLAFLVDPHGRVVDPFLRNEEEE